MPEDEQHQIAKLQAELKNLCRSVDEVKNTVSKIDEKLDDHRVLSAERAATINQVVGRVDDHDERIKKLETSFVRLAIYVALGAGGATLGIDKILSLFK